MYLSITTALAVLMALLIMAVRLKAAKKPASVKKIILPPVFMSTGALMFVIPTFRIPWGEALEAFLLGAVFSILLIKTSKLETRGDEIYLIPSRAFIVILFGLLAVRTALKWYLGQHISVYETSGLFFLIAFGMILPWRLAMLLYYKKEQKKLQDR